MAVAVRVIPCLDVSAGRVVKGVNFRNLRDAGDPVELARVYDRDRADELTFLDVSATKEGRGTMLDVVRQTAEQVFVPLTVGGGIRTVEDVRVLLEAGADKIEINSAAVARPELITEIANQFGNRRRVTHLRAADQIVVGGSADGGREGDNQQRTQQFFLHDDQRMLEILNRRLKFSVVAQATSSKLNKRRRAISSAT